MNINSQGAKPVYINNVASSSSNYTLPSGSYLVFYDGTNYYFRTDGGLPCNITNSVSTSGAISLDGRIPIHLVTLTGNASSVALSSNPPTGCSCHIIFTATAARTVVIGYNSTNRITPDASGISLDVPANGYVDVDFLNIADKIYVRGV